MTALSRRSPLAGAAALTVTGSVNAPARAAVPMAGKQGPSFYRYKIGDFEVTTLNEGVARNATPANMALNKTLPDIQKALGDAFLPTDHVINQFNVVIVNTGRNLVLIDTGFGDNGSPTTGNLLSNMAAAGIDPKNVDTILISHFHSDHINGVRAKAGSLNFPNAEIMVPATDLKFFLEAKSRRRPSRLRAFLPPASECSSRSPRTSSSSSTARNWCPASRQWMHETTARATRRFSSRRAMASCW
jgi:hypothetical protein